MRDRVVPLFARIEPLDTLAPPVRGIHDKMIARLFVADMPRFARSATDGAATPAALPTRHAPAAAHHRFTRAP